MEVEEVHSRDMSLLVLDGFSKCFHLVSIGLNGAIVYTIWRKSLMRIPSTRFVFSLCLSHLLVSFIALMISTTALISSSSSSVIKNSDEELIDIEEISSVEEFAKILGDILLFTTFGVAISALLTVTLISIERYVTIARPMKYKSIVTPRRCFVAISLSWILSALLVIFPIVFFMKKTKLCGSFVIPMGHFGWYFAGVFTLLTLLALAVMTICYSHIFSIAKEKCQKVQIGHFSASAPASISSDWPSSVHTSVHGHGQSSGRGWFHYGGARMTSTNSLLHWVLMANLRHNSNPLRSTPKSPDISPTNSVKSVPVDPHITITSTTSSKNFLRDPRLMKAKMKWRRYLRQNYNSPRKTVCTILCLIGSVLLLQLPMSLVLFTPLDHNPGLFYFCHDFLFALSSVMNPILYGFLNRNIRDQLWKIFRPKTRRKQRQKKRMNSFSNHSVLGELRDIFTTNPKTELVAIQQQNRKGSLTSEDSNSTVSTVNNTRNNPDPVPEPIPNPYSIKRKDTVGGFDEFDRLRLLKSRVESRKLNKRTSSNLTEPNRGGDENGESSSRNLERRTGLIAVAQGPPAVDDLPTAEERRISREFNVVQVDIERDAGVDDGNPNNPQQNDEEIDEMLIDELMLQNLELPRKPSQDSGADMAFSDDEQEEELENPEEEHQDIHHEEEHISVAASCRNSLRSIKNVTNYLRIYGNTYSKSDSDIHTQQTRIQCSTTTNTTTGTVRSQSQCHLGPEMLLCINSCNNHNDSDDDQLSLPPPPPSSTLLTLRSLSSSRQLLRVNPFPLYISHSADANLNYTADNALGVNYEDLRCDCDDLQQQQHQWVTSSTNNDNNIPTICATCFARRRSENEYQFVVPTNVRYSRSDNCLDKCDNKIKGFKFHDIDRDDGSTDDNDSGSSSCDSSVSDDDEDPIVGVRNHDQIKI